MQIITSTNAPAAFGHYSQAIAHNGLVFVAGQLPMDPKNPDAPLGDIDAQTKQTLRNVEAILKEAGSGLNKVLKATIFITDIGLWPAANKAYGEIFGDHKPARSAVPVAALPKGASIEIEVIAAQ